MPKPNEEIVDELNDLLRLSGDPVMTMPWPDFYELCDLERFKDPRGEHIRKIARDKWGLVIAFGQSVIVICHDRNFAPRPEGRRGPESAEFPRRVEREPRAR